MKRFLFIWLTLISIHGSAGCIIKSDSNIVFLKLDDVTDISPKWQKVTDFLESNKIAASYGVIGDSLEKNNPRYFMWLKERVAKGNIELWNHGYINAFTKSKENNVLGEFDGRNQELQAQSLHQTQQLGLKKIGITFHGFGPHNSAIDSQTYKLIDEIPAIQYVWFYKPLDQATHTQFVFQRVVNLEHPIFHPNFASFLKDYEKRPKELGYIALQGHPNMWNEVDYDNFIRIIEFLRHQKASFCKPSEIFANH